jgi:hypothetical protein
MLSDIQAYDSTDVHALHAKARPNCGPYIIVYIRKLDAGVMDVKHRLVFGRPV